MKILFYSPHPTLYFEAPTGYGSHMRGMVKGFREEGHIVEVLVLGNKPIPEVSKTNSKSIKDFLKKITPKILWRTIKEIQLLRFDKFAAQKLKHAIILHQPDLVYERSAWMSNGSSKIIKSFRINHVVEINAPFEDEVKKFENAHSLLSFLGKRKLKNLLKSASLCLPITSSLKNHLIQSYEISTDNCLVVPNAIDLEEIQFSDLRIKDIRESLSIKNEPIIGFVGSIFPYHGVDRLIKAIGKLKNSNAIALIVGDGYLIPELKSLAFNLGIDSRIHFTGSIPKKEIYDYIGAMDIVVLPNTEWYCSPVKLFEYGSMGKIIIAVNKPGVTDIMSDSDGELFENTDSSFQISLKKVLTNIDASKNHALTFQNKIIENHSWRANAKTILNKLNSK